MNQYQVIIGRHIEPLGGREKKIYNKGDIVLSDRDLCTVFYEKFKNLGPVPEAAPRLTPDLGPVEPVLAPASIPVLAAEPVRADTEATVMDPPTKPARKVKTKKGPGDWDND